MTDAKPAKRKFVRIYYVDLKRDYPDVFYDPTCLSTFIRLLVGSDESWPSPAQLPPATRRADLTKLTDCGLVELLPNLCYVVKGWVKERGEREAKARAAAIEMHNKRDADAHATA